MTAAHRLAARAPHHIPTKTNFQKQSQLFITEFYLNSIIVSRTTEFRLRAAMAKKGRKVQNNKIKKAESKALEATKPPDQTKGIEPLHELRSLPVLHIPFHPTNPDADHYGHYYSDRLYKNATLQHSEASSGISKKWTRTASSQAPSSSQSHRHHPRHHV